MPVCGRILVAFGVVALTACTRPQGQAPPNFLFILADDLGVEGLRAYGGGHYETPHLDAIAARGVRFEHAFATPVCVPSRVELLTGQYPFRNGWSMLGGERGEPKTAVSKQLPSFARSLQESGYSTAVAGKWHLGPVGQMPEHPRDLGFEAYMLWVGAPAGGRYWRPKVTENGIIRKDLERDEVYAPDLFADFLIDFIERSKDRPWLAYYPMTLVHRPYTATPDTVRTGAEAFRVGGRYGAPSDNRESVAYLDKIVGRLLAAVKRLGLGDRTYVFFTADNGSDSSTVIERNGRVMLGGKGRLDEFGAEVPLLVAGPGVRQGAVQPGPVDFTDFFPTLLELAGAPLPAGVTLDGRSFAGALRGEVSNPRTWTYVQRGERWFVSDTRFRLQHDGSLFAVGDRLSNPPLPLEMPLDPAATAAHKQLEGAVRRLRPELGVIPSLQPPAADPRA